MQKISSKWIIAIMLTGFFVFSSVFAARAATFTVTNNNDSGAGSFRQALLDANATPGANSIVFNVGVSGLQTIPVLSDLPRISEPVVIDATTQPGYTGNPLIELKGAGAQFGLIIDAGNTTIRGFIIDNFHSTGISMFTNGGNVIQNNFIGTNTAGTAAQTNFGFGIQLGNSSNNT